MHRWGLQRQNEALGIHLDRYVPSHRPTWDRAGVGSFACPECDNDVAAELIWIDRDHVRCAECGTEYDPFRGWLGKDEEVTDGAHSSSE
jgi:hypothetical protein